MRPGKGGKHSMGLLPMLHLKGGGILGRGQREGGDAAATTSPGLSPSASTKVSLSKGRSCLAATNIIFSTCQHNLENVINFVLWIHLYTFKYLGHSHLESVLKSSCVSRC